ncbi:MAG: hypothetical protein Q8R76_09560 [Candidatus Omnitrophota bacterium]|nr:hypothetical protein [Candidatus Omnitrophota bacterium]
MAKTYLVVLMVFALLGRQSAPLNAADSSEVIEESNADVRVRNHPKTGNPYVTIVDTREPDLDRIPKPELGPLVRPDYRMLDPDVRPSDVGYQGPVSDRKKVYILAASLAAAGTAAGAIGLATAPVATGAASAGGAGTFAAAGSAVTAGTISTALIQSRPDREKDDYSHESESRLIEARSSLA